MKRSVISMLGMIVVAALPVRVASQSIWLDMGPRSSVTLEILKPNLDDSFFGGFGNPLTFWNYGLFITSRTVVSDPIALVFELPLAHLSTEAEFPFTEAVSQTMIGNIYVGMDAGPGDNPTYRAEFGVRLPTAEQDKAGAAVMGAFADIERFGATIEETTTLNVLFNVAPQLNDLVRLRIRIGPSVFFPKDEGNETTLNTGVIVVMENARFRANAGIAGFTFLTLDESAFSSEASAYMFGIGGGPKFGNFYTGLDIRVPIAGDTVEDIDTVVGVSVAGFFDISGSDY